MKRNFLFYTTSPTPDGKDSWLKIASMQFLTSSFPAENYQISFATKQRALHGAACLQPEPWKAG
ncbi:MAG TPA: hypothetical protein DCP61_07095, partial [Treponema sp.]|nr:hypothetical protein [Treponema sp.]